MAAMTRNANRRNDERSCTRERAAEDRRHRDSAPSHCTLRARTLLSRRNTVRRSETKGPLQTIVTSDNSTQRIVVHVVATGRNRSHVVVVVRMRLKQYAQQLYNMLETAIMTNGIPVHMMYRATDGDEWVRSSER